MPFVSPVAEAPFVAMVARCVASFKFQENKFQDIFQVDLECMGKAVRGGFAVGDDSYESEEVVNI